MITKLIAGLRALLTPERIEPLPEAAPERKSFLRWIFSRESLPYDEPAAEPPKKTLLREFLSREHLEEEA